LIFTHNFILIDNIYSPLEGWLKAGVEIFIHLPLKGTPQRGEFEYIIHHPPINATKKPPRFWVVFLFASR